MQIYNVDSFVPRVGQRLGIPVNRTSRGMSPEELSEHFDNYIPQMCKTIFDNKPHEKYDLVVVDECQDFHKNWFNSLRKYYKRGWTDDNVF